ncbi:RadC family protein [Priestia koreensis]|nr:DNA repair protein RadC [Priestia koreensis]
MQQHYGVSRENIAIYGVDNCSLQEMLAVLIGPKANPSITGELASIGVQGLAEMSVQQLMCYEGIGLQIANRIVSAFGLSNLMRKYGCVNTSRVASPKEAASLFMDLVGQQQEKFVVAYLNTKNVVIKKKTIFVGSLNSSIVHPREVFREAVNVSAASIICAHQHPSFDPTPSREDIEVTKRINEAGLLIGIHLLDHIIIGTENKWTSLKEKGYL